MARHSKGKGFIKGIAALFLAAILIVSGGVVGYGFATDFTYQKPSETTAPDTAKVVDDDGNLLSAGKTYAMPAAMTFMAAARSSDTAQVTSSVTVTCNHKLEYANVSITWVIVNADGEEVTTSAVTVTPSEQDSATATVQCNEPFGTKLYLKAYISDNPSKSAQCELNYVKRFNVNGWYTVAQDSDSDLDIEDNFITYFTCSPSVGTVTPNKVTSKINYSIGTAFQEAIQSYLKFDITFKSYTFDFSYLEDYDFTGLSNSTNKYFSYDPEAGLCYEDLIADFEEYDAAHKNAIYYAWYKAAQNFTGKQLFGEYEVSAYYNDVLSEHVAATSEPVNNYGNLSGAYAAQGLDDLTLSEYVVF